MDLKEKIVIITGGTQGIGASCAKKMGLAGAKLAIIARHKNPKLLAELETLGATYIFIAAELNTAEGCMEAVNQVVRQWGHVNILIHCAGSGAAGDLLSVKDETWYAAFDIHIHAAFHLCRATIPLMKASGAGAVILVGSAAGGRGVKNAIAYATVKGALPQFTRALAFELADFGIRVNCVSPGVIRTRFQDMLSEEQVKNNVENRIPLHREGTPDEVADLIAHLVRNDYITGENIVIDGGLTMRIA